MYINRFLSVSARTHTYSYTYVYMYMCVIYIYIDILNSPPPRPHTHTPRKGTLVLKHEFLHTGVKHIMPGFYSRSQSCWKKTRLKSRLFGVSRILICATTSLWTQNEHVLHLQGMCVFLLLVLFSWHAKIDCKTPV